MATVDISTLSLHDALPIFLKDDPRFLVFVRCIAPNIYVTLTRARLGSTGFLKPRVVIGSVRSEEHTSELQSLRHLVCHLLLEKKIIGQSSVSSTFLRWKKK